MSRIIRYASNTNPGVTDMTAAIQAAFNCNKRITAPANVYAISSTISLSANGKDTNFSGESGYGPNGTGVVFKWIGAAGGTLFQGNSTRDSIFENFAITVGAAPSTLATAIDFDPTGRITVETGNVFRNIWIFPRSGASSPDGSLAYGFRLSRSTSTGNVDQFIFDNVLLSGCGTAAFSLEHSQSRVHTFNKVSVINSAIGISNKLNGSSGGDFQLYNGNFGGNTVTDIDLMGTGNTQIFGALSEDSKRFIDITGSNSSVPMNISGVFMTAGAVHADGQIMRFGSAATQGIGGPVVISGCNFGTTDGANPLKIGFNTTNQQIVSIGNSFNNLTPFVQNSGTRYPIESIGDRGWNGSAFVPISVPFVTFDNGDTSPSVYKSEFFTAASGGTTTITTFDDGHAGQRITILFGDGGWTIAETGNIKLSAAFVSSADDTITLMFNGTNWYEISRSVN